jgi:flagellar hook-associated protein 2
MPAITSLGIGSGADLNGLVSQLVAAERAPLQQMRSAAQGLQSQVSSFGRLTSQVSALQTAASKLSTPGLWAQNAATTSDDKAVSVLSAAGAAAGSYSIEVSQLASSQTVASNAPLAAATDLVGAGSLTLQLGTWSGVPLAFAAKASTSPAVVTFAANDTVSTMRDKINAANAGVTASIVTDATGVRLSLRSTVSGGENGFRVQAADGDGNNTDATGLSRFAFDPAGGTTATTLTQAAGNAQAVVNGIAVTSATNDLTGVVEGMTLRLRQVTTSAVDVNVSNDRDAVKTAVKAFADSYNELARNIAEQTRFDASTRRAGTLQGDSAVGSLQSQLRALVTGSSGASSVFGRLSDVGVQMQRDGTLSVDSTKLDAATLNLPELKKAFSNSDASNTNNNGFAKRFSDMATRVMGAEGTLTIRTQGLQKLITKNTADQDKLNERVDRFQQRMISQYTALDGTLARLNSLSSAVNQQINQFNNNNSR